MSHTPRLDIVAAEIYAADLPLSEPFRTARAEIHCSRNVIVRIETADGLYGTGEARPNPAVTGETQGTAIEAFKETAGLLIGRDALDIGARMTAINRALAHNTALKSAVDMALYDLLGKAAGLPLYAILGGGRRPVTTDNTVSLDEPSVMADKARQYRDEGFAAIKVKLGTTGPADLERVRKIREAVGPEVAIRLDVNSGWDPPTAVSALTAMAPFGIELCEQPLPRWDISGMGRLRAKTSIPLMADESIFNAHDAVALIRAKACDYFNIKLAKSGGIRGAMAIDAVAEAAGIPCMVGCMTETRLALTAAAHLHAARPNIIFADLDGHRNLTVDPVIGGATYRAGEITLPATPGHGADVDPGFLDQLAVYRVGG